MSPAPPPGWETRDRTRSTLWRYRPGWMHVDLTLHPALPLPTLGKHHTVRCVVVDVSPWFRFENPAGLRDVAAAIAAAADWLEAVPVPEPAPQLSIYDALEEATSG